MTMLADGQVELRADTDAALVVGPGTSYRFTTDWISWWGAATVRTADMERGGVDGLLAGRDLLGSHMTPIVVQILGDDAEDLGDKIDAWKAACAVSADDDVTVRANLLGRTRRRLGRFRIPGEIIPRGRVTVGGHVANGSCQFEALDPITYGDEETSAVTTREVAGVGVELPEQLPWSLPAGSGGGLSVTNAGNRNAPWTARLDGPLTYPEINHTQSGRRLYLSLDANGGVDLASGQYVIIDSKDRSVLLNGTSDRRSQLTIDSEWWDLPPGQNDFILRADAGAGTLTVTTRDAWHS
jgi:hypothetical protein